jgi:hypothetical protein
MFEKLFFPENESAIFYGVLSGQYGHKLCHKTLPMAHRPLDGQKLFFSARNRFFWVNNPRDIN